MKCSCETRDRVVKPFAQGIYPLRCFHPRARQPLVGCISPTRCAATSPGNAWVDGGAGRPGGFNLCHSPTLSNFPCPDLAASPGSAGQCLLHLSLGRGPPNLGAASHRDRLKPQAGPDHERASGVRGNVGVVGFTFVEMVQIGLGGIAQDSLIPSIPRRSSVEPELVARAARQRVATGWA